MRRFLMALPIALAFFVSAAAPVYAANLPLLDPNFSIVPTECTSCPCGMGGALQLIQNLMNAGISVGVIAFVLVITYAGFILVMSPTNPEAKSQARGMIMNVIIGFIIVLAAWLIVDFVMKMLYDSGGKFGPWNEILQIDDTSLCIKSQDLGQITGLPGIINLATNVVGRPGGGTGAGAGAGGGAAVGVAKGLCADSNPACSVQALKSAGLNDAQAKAMSCIAVTESSGNPNTPKSSTGACGTFQITTRPGNWSHTNYHQSPCSTSSSCNDAACNLQTAVLMFKDVGYQPWTGKNPNGTYWNPNAVACRNKYDPG